MPDLREVTVTPIVECHFGLDGGAMFGVIPKPLWTRTNPADENNRIRLATRCLVLEDGDRTVLVDAGMGDKWSQKLAGIYAVDHPDGRHLRQSLRAAGVDPDAITDVLITHLHFDHVGGLTRRGDDGNLVSTFPDATHWVQRENWVWAHHPTRRDAGSYRRENFELLATPDGPRLELVDGVSKLFDDAVEVIPTRGHTPGLQMVRFRASGETIIYVSDIMPTLGHLQLPYVMGYDVYPLTTVREKHEVLENALTNDWIVALEHDPEQGFARIERAGPEKYAVAASGATLDSVLEV